MNNLEHNALQKQESNFNQEEPIHPQEELPNTDVNSSQENLESSSPPNVTQEVVNELRLQRSHTNKEESLSVLKNSPAAKELLDRLQQEKHTSQQRVEFLIEEKFSEIRKIIRSSAEQKRSDKLAADDEKRFREFEDRMTPNEMIYENIQLQKNKDLIQEHAQNLQVELSGLDEVQEEYQTLQDEINEEEQRLEDLYERRRELWSAERRAQLQEQEALPLIQKDKKQQAQETQEETSHTLEKVSKDIQELWQSIEEKKRRVFHIKENTKYSLETIEHLNIEIDTLLEQIKQEDEHVLGEAFQTHYQNGLEYHKFAEEYNTALVHGITVPDDESGETQLGGGGGNNRVGRSLRVEDKLQLALLGPAVSASTYDEHITGDKGQAFYGKGTVGVIYGQGSKIFSASPSDATTIARSFDERGPIRTGKESHTLQEEVNKAIINRQKDTWTEQSGYNEFVVKGNPAGVWINVDTLLSSDDIGRREQNISRIYEMQKMVEAGNQSEIPAYATKNGKIYPVLAVQSPHRVVEEKKAGKRPFTKKEQESLDFGLDQFSLYDIENLEEECIVLDGAHPLEPQDMARISSPVSQEKSRQIAEDLIAKEIVDPSSEYMPSTYDASED